MAVVRVREHVNPLSQKYQTPASPPEWEKVYAVLNQPLHLDIGCGRGRFLLNMARQSDWNFLGLEIREPLVQEANNWRDELGLVNLHYLFCNVNNSLRSLLNPMPNGTLQRVTIQFPDPWFKNRHAKRRLVQPELVAELAEYLASGGVVFLQSDIEGLAVEMCDHFAAHPAFQRQGKDDHFAAHPAFQRQGKDWLPENPLPVMSEREKSTLSRGEPVYRALFIKP